MSLFKKQLTAVLTVSDYEGVVDYYENRLGLSCVDSWTDGSGLRHRVLAVVGGGQIEVAETSGTPEYGPAFMWMEAKDERGLYSTLTKQGDVNIIEPIEDKYYHATSFQMRDPAGNSTYVVSYEENVRPYTVDAVKGDFFKDEFRVVLVIDDLAACQKYYTEVLEIPCVYNWYEFEGDCGCKYAVNGTGVYIENMHRIPLTDVGRAVIRLEANDIETCWKVIKGKADAHVVRELFLNERGQYQFEVMDPDQNLIVIVGRS